MLNIFTAITFVIAWMFKRCEKVLKVVTNVIMFILGLGVVSLFVYLFIVFFTVIITYAVMIVVGLALFTIALGSAVYFIMCIVDFCSWLFNRD